MPIWEAPTTFKFVMTTTTTTTTTTSTTTSTSTSTSTTTSTSTATTTTSTTTTTTATTTTIALVDYELVDGADHLSVSQVNQKWDGDSGLPTSITTGRVSGSSAYRFNNASAQLKHTLSATRPDITLCFAYKPGSFAGSRVLARFSEGGTDQITIQTNVLGQLQAYRGVTLLGTSSLMLVGNNWTFIEIGILIDPTVGTIDIHAAQNIALSLSGINTRVTSNTWIDQVKLGVVQADSTNYDFDDILIVKGVHFSGEMRVQTKLASGAGSTTGWSVVGSGNNYSATNENAPGHDDDTSYVKAVTPVGLTDTYAVADFDVAGQIMAVQLNVINRKDDVSSRSVAPAVRIAGVDYQGDAFNCLSGYRDARMVWKQSPATNANWTLSELNGTEAGEVLTG